MTFWFRIAFTWWLGHFVSRCLKGQFVLIKYMCDSKSQTLRMRYPFQSTDRPISHRNGWSFRVYMIPLRDFVPEWNSRPGTRTEVNSRRGDSRRYEILWWYHVNKYRAMKREPERTRSGAKVAPVSCKHPLTMVNVHGSWLAFASFKAFFQASNLLLVLNELLTGLSGTSPVPHIIHLSKYFAVSVWR